MFQSLTKFLRPGEKGNYRTSQLRCAALRYTALRYAACRFAASLLLALFLPLAVSAYTIVMRDGRRVEIPDKFVVTPATLTYMVAQDISITLQMSVIDIEATERANKEPGGSLLRRASERATFETSSQLVSHEQRSDSASSRSSSTTPRALRTITNKDLEASRRTREASEAAYERRRRELGLPSLALTRQRAQEEAARAREELRRSMGEEAQAEGYWRSQASELRNQIASLNAQIDYARGVLAGMPEQRAAGSYTVLTSVAPLLQGRIMTGFPPLTARIRFGGGATRGHGFGQTTFYPRGVLASPVTLFGSAYPNDSFYDDDRAALVQKLRELELERAGLQARWRLLEDEARRAGAQPGWLRP